MYPRVFFGNRVGAAPHCDWEDLPEGTHPGRAIFDSSLLHREGGITPSSSLRSRQRLSALQPAIAPRPPLPASHHAGLMPILARLKLLSASLGRASKVTFSRTSFCSYRCVAVQNFFACGGQDQRRQILARHVDVHRVHMYVACI